MSSYLRQWYHRYDIDWYHRKVMDSDIIYGQWYHSVNYQSARRSREVKACIPCSSGAGRRGFDPRQPRRTKRAFFPPLAIWILKWSSVPFKLWPCIGHARLCRRVYSHWNLHDFISETVWFCHLTVTSQSDISRQVTCWQKSKTVY
jgi:hypothetical protein